MFKVSCMNIYVYVHISVSWVESNWTRILFEDVSPLIRKASSVLRSSVGNQVFNSEWANDPNKGDMFVKAQKLSTQLTEIILYYCSVCISCTDGQ